MPTDYTVRWKNERMAPTALAGVLDDIRGKGHAHIFVFDVEGIDDLAPEVFDALVPERSKELLLSRFEEIRGGPYRDRRITRVGVYAEAVATRAKGSGLTEEFFLSLQETGFTSWHPTTKRNAIIRLFREHGLS